MILKIETGDTGRQRELVSISLELINNNSQIQFSMFDNIAILNCVDWKKFYEQVDKRELHKWQSGDIDLPIGTEDFQKFTQEGIYNSTCLYQLFLASVDIANELNFCEIYKEDTIDTFLLQKKLNVDNPYNIKVIDYFLQKLQNRLVSSDKSLFILPYHLRDIDINEPDFNELIGMNQIGTISLTTNFGESPYLFYRPYFSPFASGINFNHRQKEILNIIKSLKRSAS